MKKTTLSLILLLVFSTMLIAGCTQRPGETPEATPAVTARPTVPTEIKQEVTNITNQTKQEVANITNQTKQEIANKTNESKQEIANVVNNTRQEIANKT
jgi:PBP1b-binding outer membrane lipoprotein LpoB